MRNRLRQKGLNGNSMVFKMITALFKRYRKLLWSVVFVSMLGCAMIIALFGSSSSLKASFDKYVKDYECPDAVITLEVTTKDILERFKGLDGVQQVDARLCADAVMISPSGRYLSVRAFSYGEDDFEKFHIWSSVEQEYVNGFYIEAGFAKNNGIKAGDQVRFLAGDKEREGYVAGIVSRPETISTQPTKDSWGSHDDFGYIYVSETLLAKESKTDHEKNAEELDRKKDELSKAEDDANRELDEAKKKLEEEKENLEKGRADLHDALEKLENSKSRLDGKKKELAEKKLELLKQKEEGLNKQLELSNAKETLLEKKTELTEKKKAFDEKKEELESQKSELITKREELVLQLEKLNQGKTELENSISLLEKANQGLSEIDQALATIQENEELLNSSEIKNAMGMAGALPENMTVEELFNLNDQLKSYVKILGDNTIAGEPSNLGEVKTLTGLIVSDNTYLNTNDTMRYVRTVRTNGQKEVGTEAYQRLTEVLARYFENPSYSNIYRAYLYAVADNSTVMVVIEQAKIVEKLDMINGDMEKMTLSEFYAGTTGLVEMIHRMEETTGETIQTVGGAVSTYQASAGNVQSSKKELTDKRGEIVGQIESRGITVSQIPEKQKEAEEKLSEAVLGIEKMQDGLKQMDDAMAQIAAGETEMAGVRKEIDEGFARIEEELIRAEEGSDEIKKALDQAEEALAEIENGSRELENNSGEIDSNIQKMNDEANRGEQEFANAEEQLNHTWLDTRTEFSNTWDELAKAYQELEEWQGYDYFCNQLLFKFEKNADPGQALDAALKELSGLEVKNSYVYEDSPVRKRIRSHLEPSKRMNSFMPLLFFGITLIVIVLFMSMIIKQSRTEIGIIRALGFTINQVRLAFCLLAMCVSVLGILFGLGIGIGLMHYVGGRYQSFFPLPLFCYRLEKKSVVIAASFSVLAGQIATLVSSTYIGRIQPSEAMSRPAPAGSTMPYFLGKISERAKPIVKFNLASLVRNKLRFVFSVLCIAASVMMIFSAFSFITSKNHILHEMFDQRIHYECQVYFLARPDEELKKELNALSYVSDLYDVSNYNVELRFGENSINTTIEALDEDCPLVGIYTKSGRKIRVPEQGIVLERHVTKKLGISRGEFVNVNGHDIMVTDISEQSVNRIQYISRSQAAVLGEGNYECILCNIDEQHESDLVAFLIGKENYALTVFTRVLYEGNREAFAVYDLMAWMIIAFSICLGLVIIVNTIQTNLFEQKKELSVLRTLGFSHGELSWHWFLQTMLQYGFACVIGLPSGVWIAKKTLKKLTSASRDYVYCNGLREYIITLALVFGFVVLSHVIAMRTMKRWNVVEIVKEE